MKYKYVRPGFSLLNMELESAILEGSYTNQPLKVANVEVDDFDDAFSAETPGPFKDIEFN